MKKVILNKCYGGFDVSYLGHELYAKKKYNVDSIFTYEWGAECYTRLDSNEEGAFIVYLTKDLGKEISHDDFNKLDDDIVMRLDKECREDSTLIEVVEELKDKASGPYGELVIVEIPDDVAEDYVIIDYDGIETLHKRVQVW